jgi:hypothetical protein
MTESNELVILSLAETHLIALASAHMSLVHLMNGTFGYRGHIVAIEKDLSRMCIILPWLTEDQDTIFALQSGRSKEYEVVDKHSVFKDNW